MRMLAIILAGLLVLIQYPLWLGKGGWLRVRELDYQLQAQQELNVRLASRNEVLEAEVADLRAGRQALEERARYGLGMIRSDELFIQVNEAAPEHQHSGSRVRTAAIDSGSEMHGGRSDRRSR